MTFVQAIIKILKRGKILEIANLDRASRKEQQEFLNEAARVILLNIVDRIDEELPEDRKATFYQLFEQPTSDKEKAVFFHTYLPHVQCIYCEAILNFKYDILQLLAQKNGTPAKPSFFSSLYSSPRVRRGVREGVWSFPRPLVTLCRLIQVSLIGVLLVLLSPVIPVGLVVRLLRRYRQPQS